MTMPTDRIRAQVALVEEHIGRENAHDLAGIMATFGQQAWYDDEPWGEHHEGREAVHDYYEDLLTSLPDLHIDIAHCLAAEEGVALEVRISGTHLGPWRGLPPTGRRVSFPLCGLFTFDQDGRLAGERIYYDREAYCSRWASTTTLNPSSAGWRRCWRIRLRLRGLMHAS